MSVPYCVVAYTGNSAEVDGVANVHGPFDRDEAEHVRRVGNEWVKAHPHNAETITEYVIFPMDPFVMARMRSVSE